uniref:Uncharacterized protein n=1 Tax=Brassica oleracea var. oleracea TaxID=109376 RepID=A0A0D2ZXH4_BRAOL
MPRDIFLEIYRGTPFLGIYRGTCSSEYSEGPRSSEFSDENSEEYFVELLRIGPSESPSKYPDEVLPRNFLGILSENSEGFPRKNEFPRSYF